MTMTAFARRGRFGSRQEGMNRRKPLWICEACEARYRMKVRSCTAPGCGSKAFKYFASQAEATRYAQLELMRECGQITDLRVQVPYPIEHHGRLITTYKADFVYRNVEGREIVEDVKPRHFRDHLYLLKKKLVEAFYRITIQEVIP